MKVTRFSRTRDLIVVPAWLWSPRSNKQVWLAVDTGSVDTVTKPGIVVQLDYSVRDGEHIMSIRSALGREQGWTLRLKRFSAFGFVVPEFRVDVFDLATGDDIDGLIGLSFLNEFNYEVRSKDGRLRAERAAAESR